MTIPCLLAFDTVDQLERHIQICHPDVAADIERWPDGALVVHHDNPTTERITGDFT